MKRRPSEEGFSLIELVIALVIIGIFATVALARFVNLSDAAKTATCMQNQCAVETASRLYSFSGRSGTVGQNPGGIEALVPEFLAHEPRCPVNGRYGYDSSSGRALCAAHPRR